jgi:hypothetical protein
MKTLCLIDGDPIPIIPNTIFFHECCGCGKLHEVHVEEDNGRIVTRWHSIDSVPSAEELELRGGFFDDSDTS